MLAYSPPIVVLSDSVYSEKKRGHKLKILKGRNDGAEENDTWDALTPDASGASIHSSIESPDVNKGDDFAPLTCERTAESHDSVDVERKPGAKCDKLSRKSTGSSDVNEKVDCAASPICESAAKNGLDTAYANRRPCRKRTETPKQRHWRLNHYHLQATKYYLPKNPDDESDYLYTFLTDRRSICGCSNNNAGGDDTAVRRFLPRSLSGMHSAKLDFLRELAFSGGDVSTPRLSSALERLVALQYSTSNWDEPPAEGRPEGSAFAPPRLEGNWMILSDLSFSGQLGKNIHGESTCMLGQISFGVFRPAKLVCSIQGIFNRVKVMREGEASYELDGVPEELVQEASRVRASLRSYDIITAFAIEPQEISGEGPASSNHTIHHAIKGVMTTTGYALPDPSHPNCLSVWITGGSIEVSDEHDLEDWKRIFKQGSSGENTEVAATLMDRGDMEDDGSISYSFHSPLGGHGRMYFKTLFLDETVRVISDNYGCDFVLVRVVE